MRSVLALLPLIAGCSVYAQHRAALVPHATPLPTDGQPMSSIAEVSVGADNLVDLITPRKGDDTQGDVVPKEQLRGQAMFRLGKNFALGGVYEHAIAQNATVLSTSEPKITGATLAGPGVQATYSIDTGTPGFRVGLATEIVFWNIPWVEYTSCVQNCVVPGYTYSDRGATVVPTMALAIVPSYRTGALTYFGGFTARNQPRRSSRRFPTTMATCGRDRSTSPRMPASRSSSARACARACSCTRRSRAIRSRTDPASGSCSRCRSVAISRARPRHHHRRPPVPEPSSRTCRHRHRPRARARSSRTCRRRPRPRRRLHRRPRRPPIRRPRRSRRCRGDLGAAIAPYIMMRYS
jgi:hypothetical protein